MEMTEVRMVPSWRVKYDIYCKYIKFKVKCKEEAEDRQPKVQLEAFPIAKGPGMGSNGGRMREPDEKPRIPAPDTVPRVKVCGVTAVGNALECAEAGADLLGINFYAGSKRYVDFGKAREWLGELKGKVERVGLFVNAERDEVLRVMESGLVDTAQFHGDETAEDMAFYAERGLVFLKVIRVRGESSVRGVAGFSTRRIVLDAWSPEGYGGTGERFDWSLARRVVGAHPELEVMLSGGLDPENVAQAVAAVGPALVDVASGVESAPGKKDIAKVAAFVRAAKEGWRRAGFPGD